MARTPWRVNYTKELLLFYGDTNISDFCEQSSTTSLSASASLLLTFTNILE